MAPQPSFPGGLVTTSARVEAMASGLGAAQGGVFGAIVVMPLDMVASKQACGDGASQRSLAQRVKDALDNGESNYAEGPDCRTSSRLHVSSARNALSSLIVSICRARRISDLEGRRQARRDSWAVVISNHLLEIELCCTESRPDVYVAVMVD